MADYLKCPHCGASINYREGKYYCDFCDITFTEKSFRITHAYEDADKDFMLPCPLCGNDDIHAYKTKQSVVICCDECELQMPVALEEYEEEDDAVLCAIARWNYRSPFANEQIGEEYLPCPFCGSKKDPKRLYTEEDDQHAFCCQDCQCGIFVNEPETDIDKKDLLADMKLLEKWNRRKK